MAVRSEIMEHVKSTILTTAALVTGLITAAHVLHPRDPAFETRRGHSVVATAEAATAWNDPPARTAPVVEAALVRPASFTLLPIAMTASLSSVEDQAEARPVRKAEHVHARRPIASTPRSQPATARVAEQAATPVASTAQPGRAAQGDPIGDLMKALGLNRDSEG
ncbi:MULTISPECIES: hypothetical protein [Methylobacterium]|nr:MULTISPECIES: hypothetical protein [Methylobacterium]TXM65160.1 hypothetical protein FV229_16425 [Methylobacterium sp. WL120]TXN81423.1 hypothetical protein FV234_13455 [Methylobacterium sp. WL8]